MTEKLIVQVSPHIHSEQTTRKLMAKVLVALTPAAAAATYIFGPRALLLIAVCVASCLACEYLACRAMRRPCPLGDLSAAVTGVLLAFNLPVTIPLPMAFIGCAFAIVVVKQLFGGVGQNFANPAITARVVLLVAFAQPMTSWALPRAAVLPVDAVTTATPLALLHGEAAGGALPGYAQLFFGLHAGSLGETCVAALLLGGVYLIASGVIRPVTPLVYLAGVALFAALLGEDPLYHLLSGGLALGAFFMATDYSTTPITDKGRVIFGLGCAALTVLIRCFGSYPEGVSFAILLMNLVTPLIDRVCQTRPFGGRLEKKKEAA